MRRSRIRRVRTAGHAEYKLSTVFRRLGDQLARVTACDFLSDVQPQSEALLMKGHVSTNEGFEQTFANLSRNRQPVIGDSQFELAILRRGSDFDGRGEVTVLQRIGN